MSTEFKWVLGMIVVGLICLYLYVLDKKGQELRKTEEGKREYVNKYMPERLKYKSKTKGKANSRNRMSKKDRRKLKEQEENNQI